MSQSYVYPSSAANVSISAIGANGDPIPSDSILVAGENPAGDLQPFQTNATGALIIAEEDPTIPRHVIVDSSALPAGASTSALQTAGNVSLASIDTKTPTVGQKAMAASSPVVIASDQASIPVTVSGVATAANQATEIASLASIDSKLTSPLTVTGPLTDTQLRATPVPISGTVSTGGLTDAQLRATPVPVSVSGVATAANQATEIASLASIDSKTPALGQALAAASVPVVLTAAQLTTLTPLATVAATQSGTWTVQPGNTANTTPWLVNSQQKTPTAGTVTSAAITVGTSAVRLTVSGSAPNANRSVLIVTPDSTSTATFYIGPAGVTNSGSTRGAQIVGGQPFVANNDAGDYYIISSVASQTVYITEQA